MKRKLLGILFFGILILGLTGCNDKIDKNVTLSVKEGTLAPIGVTLILKNESNTDYSYGEPYYIEQEIDGKWSKIQTIHEMVFNLPAWGLESGKSVEISINWVYGYGQLESGKYRIVKEIFKSSSSNIDNSVSFNVYAEFEINEENYEYEKETTEEIELKTEVDAMNHGISSEEGLVKYKAYVKNNKLYAKNLKTNEEKMIFDKEPVKNIAVRKICCAGNAHLLILTTSGNVYMSEDDSNYGFSFNFPFKKLDAKNIVSFKLVPAFDYDVAKNLYGVDSKGNEVLLHKMN
ncbi:MAG: hypothetical protein IJE89_04195 [Bacilli bacterium]|nr:hypothetical protein [Bacilli bacterium]